MEIVAVIPARYASTRLPGKPLLAETGRPLIQHVVEAAGASKRLSAIIVATDDDRIAQAVRAFGGRVEMTRADHPSGTDRVAEVAARMPSAGLFVNIQGDEPEIQASAIDRLVDVLAADHEAGMATLCTAIHDESIYRDPACVKVVFGTSGRALYFSRSPIPCHRDGKPAGAVWGYLHLGIYAYRRDFLLGLAKRAVTPLEQCERLEQLRVLESGSPIALAVVDEPGVGIDTPEDYARFVRRWRSRGGQ